MFSTLRLPGLILGYHGTTRAVVDGVLAGDTKLEASANAHDWLGSGIYFWQDSPARAVDWAREHASRRASDEPAIVGAVIQPGNTLAVTDFGNRAELRDAYDAMAEICRTHGMPLPENRAKAHGVTMNRLLDCAVIETVHRTRKMIDLPGYDTVTGVFEEGDMAFPGAGFKEKTHHQIAVRNPAAILGYFRVRGN